MVNIEIDGIPLKVDSAKMIIQAADEAGIDIPRFCYHKNLSIAANCRMCLVEVSEMRKAVPACATPVAEGMQVFTHSKTAKDAQRSVMEFLLINHPLDCPICDQGGECELQDLSLGYGEGVSRFTEKKRVVKDKNIGPLVQTDMTRCIHCTRCVRFGQEIAGIKELGATGRGEHMEIGTYVEHSLASELSGNIIDLCPVGALTSKPFRYKARAWELAAHPSIAPHDSVGSNIEIHTRRDEVMRVVPRDNDAVNESWLSDRDRFSYLALNHEQRALSPMIKVDGEWQTTDWQTAIDTAVDGLKAVKAKNGSDQIAGLISPMATVEEAYLFQKWLRGMGVSNIDFRVQQQDFADEYSQYGNTDWSIADINHNDAIVLIGCNIRSEAPIIAHRIRQAALHGAAVTELNFLANDLLMPVEQQVAVDIKGMLAHLAGIAKALIALSKRENDEWVSLLGNKTPTAFEQNVALQLSNARTATLFVGALANHHPQASKIRSLANLIAGITGSNVVIIPTANAQGVGLTGALPHAVEDGLNAMQVWEHKLRAYVLFGLEPELDCADPEAATTALKHASFVVAMNAFTTEAMLDYADVILPIATFAETSGTFVNIDNQWQSFSGAVQTKGDSRPGWKVLRVLANQTKLAGFDHVSSQDVLQEMQDKLKLASPTERRQFIPENVDCDSGLMLISEIPMYRGDGLVRRSDALQQTPENQQADYARINRNEAERFGLTDKDNITLLQNDNTFSALVQIDDNIADGCIYLAAGLQPGPAFGMVSIVSQDGVT